MIYAYSDFIRIRTEMSGKKSTRTSYYDVYFSRQFFTGYYYWPDESYKVHNRVHGHNNCR